MDTLGQLLATSTDAPLDVFLSWAEARGIALYDAQEEAILELMEDVHVILATPTGSGKSLVALALHAQHLARKQRSVYTAPIKALVSEKYRALVAEFGEANVGIMTGDGSRNRDAPILCCTAEVLAKIAVRHGDATPVHAVVMDEFHFYGDRDRGMAWQLPLLTLPHVQFLLMSATLGDTRAIEADLTARTGRTVTVVKTTERPVPLTYRYLETPLDASIAALVGAKSPIYAVHFTQRAAAERAQALLSQDVCTSEEKAHLKAVTKGFRFDSPYGKALRRFVLHGIGLHHAGLLPKYRALVETLAQQGLFKVICGTDTLGVGINVPIRSVLFTQLCKFDGQEVRILSARHFHQIAGRAGRKGFDDEGFVYAQAPDWVIENAKLEAQVASGQKKRKKVVKKKPPTRGYQHWDASTFERLQTSPPETLEPVFTVDHGLVLQLLQKAMETLDDGMDELHGLIDESHVGQRAKERLHAEADERLTQLIAAGVVVDHGPDSVPRYTVQSELQDDFSLHHALSLYLLHTLEQFDTTGPDGAFRIVSMVESILEHPGPVLAAQTSRAKTEAMTAMKADGVPYEDRIEALEEISYPKPGAEWIYATFNAYKETRPWLADAPIRPKSVVREMAEQQATFAMYVKDLGMERAEGVLLRYVSQVYRALLQNVPERYRSDELLDVVGYLRAMLARVDDSLVTPWEIGDVESDEPADQPLWADAKALRARIRAELYALVRALAASDWEEAAGAVHPESDVDFEAALRPYVEERGPVRFDARIRQGWTTVFEQETPQRWRVSQVLVDELVVEEEDVPWSIEGVVDLTDGDPGGPLVRVVAIGS
jgi:superfamily II RNA helicase